MADTVSWTEPRGSTGGCTASEPVEGAFVARWSWNPGMRTPVGSRRRMGLRREPGHDAKRAAMAMRAASDVDADDALPEGGDRFRSNAIGRPGRRIEGGTGASQKRALVAVGEEPVVADAVESARQHVPREAAQELLDVERQGLAACAVGVVPVAEAHRARVAGHQPLVGDRAAMSVAPEVLEHLLGAGEGALGVDDPSVLAQLGKEGALRARLAE